MRSRGSQWVYELISVGNVCSRSFGLLTVGYEGSIVLVAFEADR